MISIDVCLEGASSLTQRLIALKDTWWLNSLVISTTSFFNAFALFFILYLWTVNRQTHLKKTKGSSAPFKSESTSQEQDDEEEDTSEFELDLATTAPSEERRWSKLKPQKSDLRRHKTWTSINCIDVEVDEDEEVFIPPAAASKRISSRLLPSLGEEAPSKRTLLEIANRVKVFSYLGQSAMEECLKYAEYVDVPLNLTLFERGDFDGSLYVVVTGRIQCRFHEYPLENPDDENGCQSDSDSDDDVLAFSSGPGDVVTPLLALLSALVWTQKQRDDTAEKACKEPLAIASGVSAVATAQHTRLIRIPPTCFATILEKFPSDVYRVAQTILCRTQRVTLQTLVKTLGLHKELVRRDGIVGKVLEAKETREKSQEWQRITAAFQNKDGTSDTESIRQDASLVTAIELNIPLEDAPLLREQSSIVTVAPGETLIQTGLPHNAIYLLLNGTMEIGAMVRQNYHGSKSSSPSYFYRYHIVEPGIVLGRLACFAGDASLFEVRARRKSDSTTCCTLFRVPKHVFDSLVVRHPRAMTRCLEMILGLISPVVHLLNWNSDWLHVEPSEAIAHKGDRCESVFMVLNGRLRATYGRKDSSLPFSSGDSAEEYGRGKFIGEIGGLTGTKWPFDVYAIRNSELVRVPMKTLLAIIRAHPAAGVHFATMIASQVQSQQGSRHGTNNAQVKVNKSAFLEANAVRPRRNPLPSYGLNLATIAVVPLTAAVDVAGFCNELLSALNEIAPATLVTKTLAREHLGEKTYQLGNVFHEMKMTRFLGDAEEKHRLVVYQADLKYTWWTQLAIKQSDCILLLVRADEAPEKKQVERCLAWAHESMRVRIELVMISDKASTDNEDFAIRNQIDDWTEKREWVRGNQRIRSPFDHHGLDFRRMCRRITGCSVGLALGGGGARGLAHLGVIRALMEAGITVDMVGGTSQGAYIAALYAENPDHPESVTKKAREMSNTLSSVKEKLLDLTLPMTSMFSGHRFNLGIQKSFGDLRIQDLVLSFFCVSVDIQRRNQVVHRKGMLWKYVRASMSLSGYLPPVSEDGSLLVDGGYINVVPADVMRHQMRARTVIAVDVSPQTEKDYYEYGTHLSGWWLLWNSLNPFVATVQVPSMGDISDTLRWVSSDQHRKQVVHDADLYLTPPVGCYGTLEYDKFDEIIENSYEYAKPIVDKWVTDNPWIVSGSSLPTSKSRQ